MKPLSFRVKTIVGIAIIESFFLFILIYNSLSILDESHNKEFQQRATTLSLVFAAATKNAVLSSDIATLQTLIDELLVNPDILSIKVYDNINLLGQGLNSKKTNDQTLALDTYNQSAVIEVNGVPYGRVELALDNSSAHLAYEQAKGESIRIAIFEVALVALVSYFFGMYLTRNLTQIRDAIGHIKKGEYDIHYHVDSKDELGQTVKALNEMAHAIKESRDESIASYKQKQQLANKLSRREQWLKGIIDNIVDGIITLDEGGAIQSLNQPAHDMFSYKDQEIKGCKYDLFILDQGLNKEIADFIKQSCIESSSYRTSPQLDRTAHRRDGTPFPIQITLSSTRVADENIIILLIRDMSHQRTIEDKANFSQMIKSSMLESSLSAVISIDEKDNVIEFNPAAEQIFGFSKKEALASTLGNLIMPDRFREAHLKGIQHFLGTGEGPVLNKRIELSALRKNGDEFPIEIAISSAKMGDFNYFTAVIDDISLRLDAEKTLKEAKETAENANLAKSQFIASMSHEIRTPLNIILGMVNLLKDSSLNQKQNQFTEAAGQAGDNLLEIVNDVLDLSKIEAGKMEIDSKEVNITSLIEQSVTLFSHKAHEKGLSIHYWIERTVPGNITSDPTYLRRILSNLLSNAIKFTDAGGIVVGVRLSKKNGVNQLLVDVTDSGIGINHDAHKNLFKEFSQVHDVSNELGGTGLGLNISKQLANLINGDISYAYNPSGGSIFSLSIQLDNNVSPLDLHSPINNSCALLSNSPHWHNAMYQQFKAWGLKCFEIKTINELTHISKNQKGELKTLFIDAHTIVLNERIQDISLYCSSNAINIALTGWSAEELERFTTLNASCQIIEPANLNNLYAYVEATINDQSYIIVNHDDVNIETSISTLTPSQKSTTNNRFSALLVDDSDTNRIIARDYLESIGAFVIEAENGKESIEALKDNQFNVILMDVRMPVLDGVKATRIIRQTHLADRTPIIALTAHAMSSERDRCLLAGMDDFLTKPINKNTFLKTVSFWAERNRHEQLLEDKTMQPTAESANEKNLFIPAPNKSDQGNNEEPLINNKAIQQLIDDTSVSALKRMLNVYDKETRKRVVEIAQFLNDKNYDMLETYAHALKSSSQTFGAWQLHLQSKKIEDLCREKRYNEVLYLIEPLPDLMDQTLLALNEAHQYAE